MGKGEDDGHKHFLLFPKCLQRALSSDRQKSGLCGKELTLYSIDTHFDALTSDNFLKMLWEKEKCFLLNQIIVSPFVYISDNMSLFAVELEEPKIGISGKGLRHG